MPVGHLGLQVSDLPTSRAYYDALMPLLDYEPFVASADEFSYRPADGKVGTYLFFYAAVAAAAYAADQPGLQHLAFIVPTRQAVHRVHDWVEARSGSVVHPPQEFPQYHPGYYATFWLDPDGFTLEAVCHRS